MLKKTKLCILFLIITLFCCACNKNTAENTESLEISEEIVTEQPIIATDDNTVYREDKLQGEVADPYIVGNDNTEIVHTTEGSPSIIAWDDMNIYYPIVINETTIILNKTTKSEISNIDNIDLNTYGNLEDGIIFEVDINSLENVKFNYLNCINEQSTLDMIIETIGNPTSSVELNNIVEYTWSWKTEDGILQNNLTIAFNQDNTIDYLRLANINMNTYLAY